MDEVDCAIRTALAEQTVDEKDETLLKEATSCLRSTQSTVSIKLPADRQRRRRRDVFLTVHVLGGDLAVRSNHPKLFGAALKAIERLGGVKQLPTNKAIQTSTKHV
jgi:hypothetical protein